MTTQAIDAAIEAQLAESGVRYTSGRRTVVARLADAAGPMSAAELSEDLDDVPVSSIYRTLAVLSEAGILATHLSTKGLARFELAEWLTGHHHHLVCIDCGSVDDVDVPESQEATVEALVEAIASTVSFSPTNHVLEIEGRCKQCA